jgi:hypothetical protein
VLAIAAAVAVLAWTGFVTLTFVGSAIDTANSGGFVGAREARDELVIILAAAASSTALLAIAGSVSRSLFAAIFVMAILSAAVVLAITSSQVREVLAFILIIGWSWSMGAALLRAAGVSPRRLDLIASAAIATGLGLAVLSFAMLALGLVGLLTDAAMAVVLVAGVASLALRRTSPSFEKLRTGSSPLSVYGDGESEPPETAHQAGIQLPERVSLGVIATAALVGFAVCLTPQANFDALHYHLALPVIFLDEGRFVERPDIIQSYFPLGLEMVFVPAFWLGGETTANLLHWAFVPLTAAVLWPAGNRFFGRPVGAIGAALFGLMPLAVWESTATTSDLAMMFYLVAGAYVIATQPGGTGRRSAFVAGLLCGLALSFKIVAALYVLPLTLVFVGAVIASARVARSASVAFDPHPNPLPAREGGSKAGEGSTSSRDDTGERSVIRTELKPVLSPVEGLRPYGIGAFTAGGLLGGAPWLALRWLQTGNPIFPFYNDVFRSDKWPPVNERFDLDQFGIGTTLSDFVSFWWEASASPVRFGQETPDWVIGLPLLLSLGAVVLLPRLRVNGAWVWCAAAIACLLSWFLLSQYLRYGLPAFALLSLPAAFAIVEALRLLAASQAVRAAVMTALLAAWGGAGIAVGVGAFSLTPEHFPTDVLLGRESREEFRHAIPNYSAIAFFDQQTRGTDEAGALLGFPYNYYALNHLYDVIVPAELSPFRRIVEAGLAPDQLAAALVDENIRWLVYDARNPFIAETWPPEWLAQTVLAPEFVERHMEVAFEEEGVFVYRILE